MTATTFEAAAETYAKRLQILKEIIPTLEHVAVLRAQGDANVPFAMASLDKLAPAVGVILRPIDVKSSNDLLAAFDEMPRSQIEGLIVVAGALTYANSKQIANLALAYRLPSCHAFRETLIAGGLVSLGPDIVAMSRQCAAYIDKNRSRSESRCPPRGAAGPIRDVCQPQDRQGPGSHDPAHAAC